MFWINSLQLCVLKENQGANGQTFLMINIKVTEKRSFADG
jgi:hypothetical protein